MTNEERKAALEAIIYAADDPATIEQLAGALGEDKVSVRASLDELVASYAAEDRGIEIRAVAGGFKMYTKPQQHEVVRRFIKSLRPPLRLSMPALETLAVIAYKQPVTAPEISEIRAVNTSGVISTLLDKKLITTAGRKEVLGRPILYKTSKEFLMRFGLSDLDELPSLKEFEALAREALGTEDLVATSANENISSAVFAETQRTAEAQPQERPGRGPDSPAGQFDTELREGEVAATAEGMPSGMLDEEPPKANSEPDQPEGRAQQLASTGADPTRQEFLQRDEAEELREEEVAATGEGMPSGLLDEEPPKADAKSAGE